MGYMRKTGYKIESLFLDGPPPTPEEVRHILSGCSRSNAQRALLELIRKDLLSQHHFGLFVEIAKMLEVATVLSPELIAIAEDSRAPEMARRFAVVALTTTQSTEDVIELFGRLDPELVVAASDMPFIDMLTAIQMDPSVAEDLTEVLVDAAPDEQEFMLLNHIGRIRREVGTPASMAYGHALAEPRLSHLHHHMIEAVIQERDSSASTLLSALRDNAPNDEARKRFQMALLRMGTKQIEDSPGRNEPDARAYTTICDGQGAFFLICRFKMSPIHSSTATCCIRAAQEIRDAFVFPQHDDADFDGLLEELDTEKLAHTEIPLGQAATIFNDALERTKQLGIDLPDSAMPVVSLFDRISPIPLENVTGTVPQLETEKLKVLFSSPHYTSWFFDSGDLNGHGIQPPEDLPSEDWFSEAAGILSRTPLRKRLTAMLTHMARWHQWNGEQDAAEICRTALDDLTRDFAKSAVVRVMLEESLIGESDTTNGGMSDLGDLHLMPYGNEMLRTMLRRRFYADLKRPAGKHMAELDLTEVSYHHLQIAFSALPGEKRPREDDILNLAHEIAQTVVDSILKEYDTGRMIKNVERRLIKQFLPLTTREKSDVVTGVMEGIFAFLDSACQRCPKQCLTSSRKGMADVFFSSKHPALV